MYKRISSTLRPDGGRIKRLTLVVKGTKTIVREADNADFERKREKSDDRGWYYLGMFGQIGFSIALPIVGCALLGKLADGLWKSTPTWTLIGLGVGIIVSVFTFVYTIRAVLDDKTK